MALTGTRLSGNTASVGGGAVFVGYLEAIRICCSNASPDVGLSFYEPRAWRTLHSVGSVDDVCPSWKNNKAKLYGPDIGTYATRARMTIEDTTNSVCESGGEDCVIEGYRAGTELPAARMELLDRLDQGPAVSYQPITVNMSSPSEQFLTVPVIVPIEKPICTFRSITSFAPPGVYKLTIELGEGEIENIDITVRVRDCIIGEMMSKDGICVDCGSMTYNTFPGNNDCRPCPEHGICVSRVITPFDGYWHGMPCSDRLRRCIPRSACHYDGRSHYLLVEVMNVTSCDFDETWIERYAQVQCAEARCIPGPSGVSMIRLFVPKGSCRPTLWILRERLWVRSVPRMQAVPEVVHPRGLHCRIGALSLGNDGHHHQRRARRSSGKHRAGS